MVNVSTRKGKKMCQLSIFESNLTFSRSIPIFSLTLNAQIGGRHRFQSPVEEIASTLDDGGSQPC